MTTAGRLDSADGVRWLLGHREDLGGVPRRKAQLLLESSALAYLRRRVSGPEEALSTALRRDVGGVSLAAFPFLVVDTDDSAERTRLEEDYVAALREISPLWRNRLDALSEAAREAGFPDLPDMVWDVFNLNGREFIESCLAIVRSGPAVLPGTPGGIGELAARAGVVTGAAGARGGEAPVPLRDWLHLYRRILAWCGEGAARPAAAVGAVGCRSSAATAAVRVAGEAGVRRDSPIIGHGVAALDLVRRLGLLRPSRLELRFVAPEGDLTAGRGMAEWKAGGEEAAISVMDEPGLTALPVILHEMGHAAEGAGREPGLAPEFAGLVDPSVSEAWALLFAAAAHSSAWLGRLVGPKQAQLAAEANRLRDILSVRRLAAMAVFTAGLFGAETAGAGKVPPEEVYAGLMMQATGVRHPPGIAYADGEDLWRVVAYLRGFALAKTALARLGGGGEPPRMDALVAPGALVAPEDFAAHFGGVLDLGAAAEYGLSETPFPPC